MRKAYIILTSWRFFFHWLYFKNAHNRNDMEQDLLRNLNQFCWPTEKVTFYGFCYLMTFYIMFRNIFYARVGREHHWWMKGLCILAAPQQFLDITSTGELGGGLIVQHGYNTLISPAKMGKNCWINQGVSIGHRTKGGQPVIGDNVRIAAGALVLGAIKIGRGATVAPGAVVMKHVPPYAIVTGNPAKIIGFNMTPEEVVEFEAKEYPEEERIPLIKLQKNYEKHYINKREEIAEFLS